MAKYDDPIYDEFKRDFCSFFDGKELLKLRFFFGDHVDVMNLEVDKEVVPLDLLNELEDAADDLGRLEPVISPTRVYILWEITTIVKNVHAQECVSKYIKDKQLFLEEDQLEGDGIKPYRRKLYEAIKATEKRDFNDLKAFYRLKSIIGIKTIWDVVHHLQKIGKLETREHLNRFARSLNKGARKKIEDGLHAMIPLDEEQNLVRRNKDKLADLVEVSEETVSQIRDEEEQDEAGGGLTGQDAIDSGTGATSTTTPSPMDTGS